MVDSSCPTYVGSQATRTLSAHIKEQHQDVTMISCAVICRNDKACGAFNYKELDGTCEIVSGPAGTVAADQGWVYYMPQC